MNNILSEKDTQAIFDILVEQIGVQRAQLVPAARIKEDLGADSLTIAETVLALEERFNLTIPDEQWESVSTVGDVFETLEKLLAALRAESVQTID